MATDSGRWTYDGTFPHFSVFEMSANAAAADTINGLWPTEVDALEALILGLEDTRRDLARALAEVKRKRRKLLAQNQSDEHGDKG